MPIGLLQVTAGGALLVLLLVASAAAGQSPQALQPLVGRPERVLVAAGETLLEIAHRERLGFEAVSRLNPRVDPWIPVPGTIVQLPTRSILPPAAAEGLVINVPEMRLYDFTVSPAESFAIAIGDAEDPSLVGDFRIGEKRTDPAWNVPESIRDEKPELPAVVPPGPENPLGSRWMTIGTTSYGIHGTNLRWSIGRTATHGCIRLYEDEIVRLFDRVPPGTRVQLVYVPFKWGREGERLYLEVHPDVYGRVPDRLYHALATPRALGLLGSLDLARVMLAVDLASGFPTAVGSLPPGWEPPQPGAPPEPTSRPRS